MKRTATLVTAMMAFALTACTQNNKPSGTLEKQMDSAQTKGKTEVNNQKEKLWKEDIPFFNIYTEGIYINNKKEGIWIDRFLCDMVRALQGHSPCPGGNSR